MDRTEFYQEKKELQLKRIANEDFIMLIFSFCPFAWNAISTALHYGILNLNNQISLFAPHHCHHVYFSLNFIWYKKIIFTLLISIELTTLQGFFHFVNWQGKKIEFFSGELHKTGWYDFHGSNLISFFRLVLLAVDTIVITDAFLSLPISLIPR